MKHLFYIHSHITYHVSLEVIKHEKLDASDCVFMYGRKFQPLAAPLGIEQVELPFTHHPINSFAVARKFWRGWNKLSDFDRFTQNLVGKNSFRLYTNQSGIDFIRLFISHRQCAGFSFLEEGMASYYSLKEMNTEVGPAGNSTVFFKALLLLNFRGGFLPASGSMTAGMIMLTESQRHLSRVFRERCCCHFLFITAPLCRLMGVSLFWMPLLNTVSHR